MNNIVNNQSYDNFFTDEEFVYMVESLRAFFIDASKIFKKCIIGNSTR